MPCHAMPCTVPFRMLVFACVVGFVVGMRGPAGALSLALDSRLSCFDARGAFVVFKRAQNRPLKPLRRARGTAARNCGCSIRIAGCMMARCSKGRDYPAQSRCWLEVLQLARSRKWANSPQRDRVLALFHLDRCGGFIFSTTIQPSKTLRRSSSASRAMQNGFLPC